jgi:acyl carrier protein
MTRVQDILIDQLHVSREQITPEARIEADLGADSLDMVEIAMKAEEEFSLTLPDEDAEKIATVEDLYEAVGALLGRAR